MNSVQRVVRWLFVALLVVAGLCTLAQAYGIIRAVDAGAIAVFIVIMVILCWIGFLVEEGD